MIVIKISIIISIVLLSSSHQVITEIISQNEQLLQASTYGNIEEVKLLLLNNSDVNAISPHGFTALILAAENGHTDIVVVRPQFIPHSAIIKFRFGIPETKKPVKYLHHMIGKEYSDELASFSSLT